MRREDRGQPNEYESLDLYRGRRKCLPLLYNFKVLEIFSRICLEYNRLPCKHGNDA